MTTLLDRIDERIARRHLLGHPFYRKWTAGTLPVEALREYARQYYAFESAFPRMLSALHTRAEDGEVRAALLDNLWDEEHGAANHAELWLRFAEGAGVARDGVRDARPNPATRALVDAYWRAAREAPVAAGVAAVYAYERQVPEVAQAKIEGLERHYGIADARTLEFFNVHAAVDVRHAAAERRVIERHGASDPETVEGCAQAALDGWWGFLDAVDPRAACSP